MPSLQSSIIAESAQFKANREAHLALLDQLRAIESRICAASARSKAKFAKRGQLLPRERVALLLDRGASFIELSTLAGLGFHEDDGADQVYGGGIIAGIGLVSGRRIMVIAHDAGIKGGAAHPYGVEKQLRAQEIAIENKLPLVQLIESAGANLMLQAEMFVNGGKIFANLARMSALGNGVVGVVHGSSTAGGAYQVGLSDYTIMVRARSKVFLAGPPLLKAATGEIADDEALGGSELHSAVTGLGDYLAENDADGIRIARDIVGRMPRSGSPVRAYAEPLYGAEDLLGIVPTDHRRPYDAREVVARIVDGSDFLEFKPRYGTWTLCGHAAIQGHPVGIIGNNGPIDADGATKAAQFIQLCCQSDTPILFLQNTTGFMVGTDAERAGIVKHGSKMIQAVTNATVPKITIQLGGSFGAGHYAMCGRAFAPRFIFAWPNNRVSVMGGEQAAKVLTIIGEDSAEARGQEPDRAAMEAMSERLIDTYQRQSAATYASARLWDDGIIDPRDTRRVLGECLAICEAAEQQVLQPNSFGVARL